MDPQRKKPAGEESACRILGDMMGRTNKHLDARRDAAYALFEKFVELAKMYGMPVRLEGTVAVSIGSGDKMALVVNDGGWPCLATRERGEVALELQYDPIEQRFEGTNIDPNVEPEPGKLRPRLSALTVLAGAVKEALQSK